MDTSAEGADAGRKRLAVLPGGAEEDPHVDDRASRALARAWFRLWNDDPGESLAGDRGDHIVSGGSGVDDAPLPA